MATAYALTEIRYGYVEDGQNKRVVIAEGEKVLAKDLPKEVIESLIASGAIGPLEEDPVSEPAPEPPAPQTGTKPATGKDGG